MDLAGPARTAAFGVDSTFKSVMARREGWVAVAIVVIFFLMLVAELASASISLSQPRSWFFGRFIMGPARWA